MNKNFHYLVEGISKDIIAFLMADRSIDITEAITLLYNSATFEKLSNVETGLYIESSSYVYDILQRELKMGKITQ